MSEQQGFEQEELEEQIESYEEDSNQEEETKVDPNSARLEKLEGMISQLLSGSQQNAQPRNETKGLTLTQDQIAALKDNPQALLALIEEKTNQTVNSVNLTLQQDRWDSKAKDDFPALKSDSKFKELVKQEVQELVSNGDMTKDSPRLLYVAAKIASSKYQAKNPESAKKADTSALRPGAKKPNTAPTEKQRSEFAQKTQILRSAGYSEEKIKSMLEKYEKSTQTVKTRSGLTRRFTQL